MGIDKNRRKIIISVFVLISIVSVGMIGYIFIEGFDILEAFYMTIITISTVGYGEVHELSEGGKIFTSLLILTSLGVLAYVASVITTQFFEGQLSIILSGYQKKSRLKKMKNHIIVCGFGRNGQQSVLELNALGTDFIIIDTNKELLIQHCQNKFSFIEGDATQDEILEQANIKNARALITTLPNDADNLFVALTAKSLNPELKIISRASNISSEKKLYIAGVDNIVMPERVGGAHMAHLVAHPDIIEFMDHLSTRGESFVNLEEVICDNLPKTVINKSIDELGVRKNSGVNIIGIKQPDGEYIVNPSPDTKVIPNSKIFVLGSHEQIEKMRKIVYEQP